MISLPNHYQAGSFDALIDHTFEEIIKPGEDYQINVDVVEGRWSHHGYRGCTRIYSVQQKQKLLATFREGGLFFETTREMDENCENQRQYFLEELDKKLEEGYLLTQEGRTFQIVRSEPEQLTLPGI